MAGDGLGLGIDVSKKTVDYATSDGAVRGTVTRSAAGLGRMVAAVRHLPIHRVVVEASGGYERAVLETLVVAELPVVLVQPVRARHFAKALGRYPKTDAIDAAVLARMAAVAVEGVPLWKPPSEEAAGLRALVDRRRQLVTMIDSESKRLRQASAVVRDDVAELLALLRERLRKVEQRLAAQIASCDELAARAALLTEVRGIGLVTAATLLVYVPELGTLRRREVASLVGVAPVNRDSGTWSGRRFIHGGRREARQALYMATLAAIQHNEHIRPFFRRLRGRGKHGKVALVACMRKLIIHLNARLRVQPEVSTTA